MDPSPDPVTRLGPDSGGRGPGEGGPGPDMRVYTWEWGTPGARRPGLPWIGIFLVVFGVLLLIQRLNPAAEGLTSIFGMAIGIAFLIKWAVDRGTGSLYAGALITALVAPGVINAAGFDADGLGTLCFGVAFLFIAAVRAAGGGGWGWQLLFGGLLALIGGANMLTPEMGGLILPIALLVLGAALLVGSSRGRRP